MSGYATVSYLSDSADTCNRLYSSAGFGSLDLGTIPGNATARRRGSAFDHVWHRWTDGFHPHIPLRETNVPINTRTDPIVTLPSILPMTCAPTQIHGCDPGISTRNIGPGFVDPTSGTLNLADEAPTSATTDLANDKPTATARG